MKKNNAIQYLSLDQWLTLWCAYWRLWPIVLRIKFKQFFKDTRWISKNITFVQNASTDKGENGMLTLSSDASIDLERAKQLHESVRLAARLHFLPARCLPRSIVLAKLLESRGISATVCVGVSKKSNMFASHAWLEVHGVMVAEPETITHDFTRLKS